MSKSSCYWECIRATHNLKIFFKNRQYHDYWKQKKKSQGRTFGSLSVSVKDYRRKTSKTNTQHKCKNYIDSDRAGVGAQNIRLWFNTQHHTTTWTPPTTGLRTSVLFLFRFGLVYFCLNMLLYQKDVLI